ncbi:hypothetical protein C8R45DRAFT_941169 [Mycena sanguinolenta]|nr:hypothetical protein C8R45DRAFT_941169 [Mycena sanguinolenta]
MPSCDTLITSRFLYPALLCDSIHFKIVPIIDTSFVPIGKDVPRQDAELGEGFRRDGLEGAGGVREALVGGEVVEVVRVHCVASVYAFGPQEFWWYRAPRQIFMIPETAGFFGLIWPPPKIQLQFCSASSIFNAKTQESTCMGLKASRQCRSPVRQAKSQFLKLRFPSQANPVLIFNSKPSSVQFDYHWNMSRNEEWVDRKGCKGRVLEDSPLVSCDPIRTPDMCALMVEGLGDIQDSRCHHVAVVVGITALLIKCGCSALNWPVSYPANGVVIHIRLLPTAGQQTEWVLFYSTRPLRCTRRLEAFGCCVTIAIVLSQRIVLKNKPFDKRWGLY